jgi:hypothetical protein
MKVTIEGVLWTGDIYEVGTNKPFPTLYHAINLSNLRQQAAVYVIYDDQNLNIFQQEVKYPCYFVGMKPLGEIIITAGSNFRFHTNIVYLENVVIEGMLFRGGNYDFRPLIKANKSVVGLYNTSISFYELPGSTIFLTNVSCLNYGYKLGDQGGGISKPDTYLDKVSFTGEWKISHDSGGLYGLDDKQPVEIEYTMTPEIPGITVVDDYAGFMWFDSQVDLTYQASTKTLKNDDVGFVIDLSSGGEIKYFIPEEFGGDGEKYITLNVNLSELPITDVTENVTIIKEPVDPVGYGAMYGLPGKYVLVEQANIPAVVPVPPTPVPWTNTFLEKIEIEGKKWNGVVKTVGTGKDFATVLEAIDHSNQNYHNCVYLIYQNDTFTTDLNHLLSFDGYFLGMDTTQGYLDITMEGAVGGTNYCSKLYVENLKINGFVPWVPCFPISIKTNRVQFKDNPYGTLGCSVNVCKNVMYYNSLISNTNASFALCNLDNVTLDKVTYCPPWNLNQCTGVPILEDIKPVNFTFSYLIENCIPGITVVSDNMLTSSFMFEVPYLFVAATKVITFDNLVVDLSSGGNIVVVVNPPDNTITLNVDLSKLPVTDMSGIVTLKKYEVPVSVPNYGPENGVSGKLISVGKKPKNDKKIGIISKIIDFFKKIFKVKDKK